MQVCNHCGLNKPLSDFGRAKAKKSVAFHANTTQEYKKTCKSCLAKIAREWRAKNPGYDGTGRFAAFPKEDRKLISVICSRLTEAKARIKKFNKIPTDLTIEYLYELFLKQGRKCALTGETLVLDKKSPVGMSLDQIEPSKGYAVGNVQWLAWAVNRAKGDLDTLTFLRMCGRITERATTIEKQQ